MNLVLLSGGSGKRLWPLSNDIRSKQFIKLFRHGDTYESMVQRVCRQIREADPHARVTIATSRSQVSALRNQLGDRVALSVEPCRRDTFPAIALAAAYLRDVQGLSSAEPVVVCPVDPYVETAYFRTLSRLSRRAAAGSARLVLMGITPTEPSEKFGYILPAGTGDCVPVKRFTEKPDRETAAAYIAAGALWNSGVFAFRLEHVLNIARQRFGHNDHRWLSEHYAQLEKISFDYAVAEREPAAELLRYSGTWNDLGTWDTLTAAMEEHSVGPVMMNDRCRQTHVINELNVPVLCMGLHNVVVSASPEGILVADKEQSTQIKPFVDLIRQEIMFAEKSWGSYRVLDVEEESLTIQVTLNPGHSMHYHSHAARSEVWTVIEGRGRTIVDGAERSVGVGDVILLPVGCRHTVIAETELKLIEVQTGSAISVHDKELHPLPSAAP